MDYESTESERREAFPILRFFAFDHLPYRLQLVSTPFFHVAHDLVDVYETSEDSVDKSEMEFALRQLLLAKDAAVRAVL
jgi:hypothetical protein